MSQKTNYKSAWKNTYKMKFTDEEFEFIWGVYESIDKCMLCSKDFKSRYDKCLDHDHATGEPRMILCRGCNGHYDRKIRKDNTSGVSGIGERKYSWIIRDRSSNKRIYKCFAKSKYSLDEVIQIKKLKYSLTI